MYRGATYSFILLLAVAAGGAAFTRLSANVLKTVKAGSGDECRKFCLSDAGG